MPDASPRKASQLWLYLFCGILAEVLLVIAGLSLPEDSAAAIHLRNFFLIVHYPLFYLVEALRLEDLFPEMLLLVLLGLVMGIVWAFILYWFLSFFRWFRSRFLKSQKRRAIAGAAIFLIGMSLIAQIALNTVLAIPRPFTKTPEVEALVQSNTVFAIDLYKKLADRPGNLFFSPFGISTSLAMTSSGARGQTADEMAKTLHLDLAGNKIAPAYKNLIERINRLQRWNRISLLMANGLWCDKSQQLLNPFLDVVHNDYEAEASQLDFKDASRAAQEINDWVTRKTDGKISSAVEAAQFDPALKLILADAVYFKGKWLHQFKTGDTKPAPFMVSTNLTVTVPMMWQKSDFKTTHSEDGLVELLELPYLGQDLSMVILLPAETAESLGSGQYDLAGLEQNLTPDNLRVWLKKLDETTTDKTLVWLPRFTTTQELNLTDTLKSMGLVSAFDRTSDFSGMDGMEDLYLSDVLHKTFVKVDEAGTEAAAITLELAKASSMSECFNANHPFLYLIRDNGSGSILFMGRMIDPTK